MRDREKDEKTQEQEEYLRSQAEWVKNVGGLRKGDHLLVLDHPMADQAGWTASSPQMFGDWTGRTVQFQGDVGVVRGIKCHSFGRFDFLPFFVLSKLDRKK